MNPIIEVLDNNEQQEQQFPMFKTHRYIIIDWEQIFKIYF